MSSAASANDLLIEQRRRWEQGDPVRAEELLARRVLPVDAALDLVVNEVLLRQERGETPTLGEYQIRFPQWAAEIKTQFEVESALDSPSMKASTQELADGAKTVVAPQTPITKSAPPSGLAGYEILETIGRGGMGVVYKARHLGLNRLVALKTIRAGAEADAEERARFRQEAEASAQLQHPNVTQVYDVGEADGQVYLALELVTGGTLAQRINGAPQPPEKAARCVEQLARAIHEAHTKGIIHRDLKPANILLTSDDIPKITDFGLAKRIASTGGLTKTGYILGTPSYMSPEQARGQSHQVGPAADIYALGAVLYELLTGRPPFRGETEWDTVSQVLSHEPVSPRSLQPTVPLDLETICLKCLAKEQGRRYSTAEALADDLKRFTEGRPIFARPVGALERLARWCRRNPRDAIVVGVIAGLLLTITIVSTVSVYLIDESRNDALENAAIANKARDRARLALDDMSSQVVEDWLFKQKELSPKQREFMEKALSSYEEFAKETGSTPETRFGVARAYYSMARIRHGLKQFPQAEAAFRRGLELTTALVKDFPDDLSYKPQLAEFHNQLGILLAELGRADEALQEYATARDITKELVETDIENPSHPEDLASICNNRALLLTRHGRFADASVEFKAAISYLEKLLANSTNRRSEMERKVAQTRTSFAGELQKYGRQAEALSEQYEAMKLQKKLLRDSPNAPDLLQDLGRSHHNLGLLLGNLKKQDDALAEYQSAIKIFEKLSEEFPGRPELLADLARARMARGLFLQEMGQHEKALPDLQAVVPLHEKLVVRVPTPLSEEMLATTLNSRGLAFKALGRKKEAIDDFKNSINLWKKLVALAPNDLGYATYLGGAWCNISDVHRSLGDSAAAIAGFDEAATVLSGVVAKEPNLTRARLFLRNVHWFRALTHRELKRWDRALPDWENAIRFDDENGILRRSFKYQRALELVRLRKYAEAGIAADQFAKNEVDGKSDLENCGLSAIILALTSAAVAADDKLQPEARKSAAAKYAARSIDYLREAWKGGHVTLESINNTPEIEYLRAYPEYQRFIAELEKIPAGKK